MFLTFLVIAHLLYTQANGIKLQPAKPIVVTQLHIPVVQGIQLKPAHVTVVTTFKEF